MSTESTNQLDTLAKARRLLRRNILRNREFINELIKPTATEAEGRLEFLRNDLTDLKNKFDRNINEAMLLINVGTEEGKAQEAALYKEIDEVQLSIMNSLGKITSYTKAQSSTVSRDSLLNASIINTSSSGAENSIRLPKINIPKFDGNPRTFLRFKGLFKNLVHDEVSIPNVRKLYYLQEALAEGKAETLIRDIEITDAAYDEAWQRVLDKYDNKRKIIRTHFDDLFTTRQIQNESELPKLIDIISSCLGGLKVCGEKIENWSSILSYLVASKLDAVTKKDFENSLDDTTSFPSMETLMKFLKQRAGAIDECAPLKLNEKAEEGKKVSNKSSRKIDDQKRVVSNATTVKKCPACGEQHLLIECKVFAGKNPYQRYTVIKANGLCRNCFGSNHLAEDCRSRPCKLCNEKHHTMIHFEPKPTPVANDSTKSPSVKQEKIAENSETKSQLTEKKVCATATANSFVLLPSAVVLFQCGGKQGRARILGDSCSQATLISDAFIHRHRLPTEASDKAVNIHGVAEEVVVSNRSCNLTLKSRINGFSINICGSIVPATSFKYEPCITAINYLKSTLDYVQFAEAELGYQSVDIILGAEYIESCYLAGSMTIERVTLRNSYFGWISSGVAPVADVDATKHTSYQCCYQVSISSIEKQLKVLWDSEEFNQQSSKSIENEECEKHFEENFTRDYNGRFVVKLPVKGNLCKLSDTTKMAKNSVTKILNKPNLIQNEYHAFIKDYVNLKQMELIDMNKDKSGINYILPQLLVLRPDKTTTKLRVVFHASFKTKQGLSLNDILMAGPTLQLDLFDIMVRFRRHRIGFAADIEKMYRQILVHPDHQHLQKIYYQPESGNMKIGILKTVTYGTKPASFLAIKCLFVLADEIENENRAAAEAIRKDFYMDDFISGADSVDEAINLRNRVSKTLLSAHLPLRKYCSNSAEFLSKIEPELIESCHHYDFQPKDVKVLGLRWLHEKDELSVNLKSHPLPNIITKRILLSELASIFDILGLLAPVTIRGKILMQLVWQENIDWDNEVPEPIRSQFIKFHNDLTNLNMVSINRHYSGMLSTCNFRLVGFCDASDRAYCAVIYLLINCEDQPSKVSFVCAKTRVAPLKNKLTIPKLELQAAALLAKLIEKLASIFDRKPVEVTAFSDSTTVLSWLSKPNSFWKTFVSNRVKDITKVIPYEKWGYVNTKENPADLGTRGISVESLINSELWKKGPNFLANCEAKIHKPIETPNPESLIEQKLVHVCATIGSESLENAYLHLQRFSSYLRLIRTYSLVLQALDKFKGKHDEIDLVKYQENAFNYLLRLCQSHDFFEDQKRMENSQNLSKTSPLKSLSPFLDKNNIIRVGGRLENSNLPYDVKHPPIIKASSHLLYLFVVHIHLKFFHVSRSFLLRFVRSRFWVTGSLVNVVKKVIRLCVQCTRIHAPVTKQIMGQLPPARCQISKPFTHVGVDFCGPFTTKCVNHRTTKHLKTYVAVFVCMFSRAVHLEVVSDLSSDAFLLTLNRFVSRRGLPREIWSDNGTNFVGAARILEGKDVKVSEFCINQSIKWKFVTPQSPHHGGLWEAAVKSAKKLAVNIIGGHALSYEELSTIFAQIESILNSRPVCYNKSEGNDITILTPGHLLIGAELWSTPKPEIEKISMFKRYQLTNNLIRSFWKEWAPGYLCSLQPKTKWHQPESNVTVGDIVLVKGEFEHPNQWPLGRVITTYPDTNGVVRVVDLEVRGKVVKRNITRLVRLPKE